MNLMSWVGVERLLYDGGAFWTSESEMEIIPRGGV